MELDRYNVDVAVLCETRFADSGSIVEECAGYTIFWSGSPAAERRLHGVAVAIRTPLAKDIIPKPINERLITIRLPIGGRRHLTVIGAYAPTMANDDDVKEQFYLDLSAIIRKTPKEDKLMILGDMNARVGTDFQTWPGVIGKHGVGSCNSNGRLLLELCTEMELIITNTWFQLSNMQKTTWMHPRSKRWHLLDYVLVRKRDIRDIVLTRAMRGAECNTDHRLVRCIVSLHVRPPVRKRSFKLPKKLNVKVLKDPTISDKLQQEMKKKLSEELPSLENSDITTAWTNFRDNVYDVALTVLGPAKREHPDWFAENLKIIQPLVDAKNQAHKKFLGRNTRANKKAFQNAKKELQKNTRRLKDEWMRAKAREIQHYADIHDTKKFYQAAKEIYGPQTGGSSPLFTADGLTLLSDPDRTLERWKEHFSELLNATPRVNFACIKAVPQQQIRYQLDRDPSFEETVWAVKELQNGKAPGEDGIPAEILKRGGDRLLQHLHQIIMMIWSCEQVPSQLKDAIIVAIFKNKGSRKECGNYRGISLLSITGKVLTKIMQNRLSTEVVETNVSESQYGFRKNRGTVDMIFVARHIQEKCIEQNKGLFAVFIDLNKAFDSVPREALWLVLGKQGVPKKFLSVLRQFHSGMTGRVCANGAFSDSFGIDTGVKQGCCVAPSLFALYFDAMLGEAFRDSNFGINLKYRIDGGLFRLSRLQAVTKIKYTTFRDLLFADDCALFAHTEIELQNLMTSFAEAAVNFGLTVSIKKTEVLHQPSPINIAVPAPEISIDHRQLKNCQSFIYLGSILSNNGQLDQEINCRINKASSSFGRLYDRIWRSHDIKLSTKIEVYRAVVLTTLLYSAECWTVYRKHIKLLEAFQQRCLRKIAGISYKDKVSNQEVLEKTLCPSVESQLMKIRLRWVGHVARMEDNRMPKQILYGELEEGRRGRGRPKLRYKDLVKKDISLAGIPVYGWEQLASRREEWRRRINEGVERFENERANRVKEARLRRKNPELAAPCEFRCGICQRPCASAAGLAAHNRSHRN